MKRAEKLELLLKIEESIDHFEKKIDDLKWSNTWGIGLEVLWIGRKNTNDIDTCKMCIDRLNERFTKQLNTLK